MIATTPGRSAMRAVFVILLTLSLSACDEVYWHVKTGDVGWALKNALRDKKSTRIELAMLTTFQWDEFFLFGPYQPTDGVCKRLGLMSAACKSVITAESVDDSEMLMVFRYQGKVVHAEMHNRWHGDFTPVSEKPFTPQTAIFSVTIEGKGAGGGDWLKLRAVRDITSAQ
ncbi:hypothetical protein [Denitromonas halophila]|uniref:Uncharacterized protein n=1 Tax=Denitromonas halophila TaxID=1629404 RepID=A0A557QK62_9RHOO|nr:hypothetical protein [Denitromonas halophila]TVO53295.1 hypothetical protein FHP91_16030 [Denitromonas halophila]